MINHPGAIEFEITSKCTLFCPECPRTKDKEEKMHRWNYGELAFEVIEKVIKNTPAENIIFSGGYGDPIYHSKFIEVMELCKIYNKNVTVNTNGSYRTKEWWHELAEKIGQRVIFVFSVDGIESSNHIYRVNSNWSSILDGMEIMAKHAACSTEWKWIVFKHNELDIEQGYMLSRQLGIDAFTLVKTGRPYPTGMEPTIPFDLLLNRLNTLKEKLHDTGS
jgi:MoaA/NifB/PqqE/SkfB family radical SAM enzyme